MGFEGEFLAFLGWGRDPRSDKGKSLIKMRERMEGRGWKNPDKTKPAAGAAGEIPACRCFGAEKAAKKPKYWEKNA